MTLYEKNFILLVEDNQQDELLTIRALKKNNIKNEIVVCRDGEDALDFLFARGKYSDRDRSHLPQLVLLDLKLPKIDGLGVLKQVREDSIYKNLPVVILTTSDEEQDIASGYALGVNSYVKKPVDFIEFSEAVKLLGVYWLVLNVNPPSSEDAK